ncbi:MAG: hypothetical protein WCO56_19805 [Verrucomicrobiota bacterium]
MKFQQNILRRGCLAILTLLVGSQVFGLDTNSWILYVTRQPRVLGNGIVLDRDTNGITIYTIDARETIPLTNLLSLSGARLDPTGGYVPTPPPPTNTSLSPTTSTNKLVPDELCAVAGLVTTNKTPAESYLGMPTPVLRLSSTANPPANLDEYIAWLNDTNAAKGFTEWYYIPSQNRLEKYFIPAPAQKVAPVSWADLRTFIMAYKKADRPYVENMFVGRHYALDLITTANEAGIAATLMRYTTSNAVFNCVQFPTTDAGIVLIDTTQYPTKTYPTPFVIYDIQVGSPVQSFPIVLCPKEAPLPSREERVKQRGYEDGGPVLGTMTAP